MAEVQNQGDDRRAFLAKAGKLALLAPPAMTVLLSTSMTSNAIAQSHGGSSSNCNRGGGNGPEGCDPGNSGGKPGNAGEGNNG